MTVEVSDRFVARQDGVRASIGNRVAADVSYDTAVLSDGDGFTFSDGAVGVDSGGLFLNIFDLGKAFGPGVRACGTLVPRVDGTDRATFRATHRYLRNGSGGVSIGASIGAAILALDTGAVVGVRNPGELAPTSAALAYSTVGGLGGALQLVRLPDGNLTSLRRTVNSGLVGRSRVAVRPWTDASGVWTTVGFDTVDRDDDAMWRQADNEIVLGPAGGKI